MIAVALTGASGAQYGLRLLQCLVGAGRDVGVMISGPAQLVVNMETDLRLTGSAAQIEGTLVEYTGAAAGQLTVYGKEQWTAPVASGSNPPEAMVVCPCTTATLAAVATGAGRSLIERAADVVIKERRPLVLVVREMPFSPIHLEHMLKLARIGVTIMPANPAFYHHPASVDDLVDFVVARVLDHLRVEHALTKRWGASG
ncbi:MAG: UbiX family flavin prenyltransferase [Xanthomonadaceae bacterium]|nr:UbiX family flavin prenyltransferase [Xanthomonadaceae bacterium]